MARKTRYGIVGAGAIAQTWSEAFSGCSSSELTAVCDVRMDAAAALAEGFACKSFDSYQAMQEKANVDAVIICTPPATHREIAQFFLERKVHVLCEKPLTTNISDALQLVATAKKNGVILTMASKFRYVEDVIRAKSIVMSGILGEIILFENAFTARVDMSSRWNSDPELSGGGVLIDNGTHSVDIMRYFLGPLLDVQVVEGKRTQKLPVEDTVRMFLHSSTGVLGSIDLSWSINKELDSYINIYGTQGTIFVGWRESKYRQTSGTDWVIFGQGYNKLQAFQSQLDNFSNAINGREILLINCDDAIASVEVIRTAYETLKQSHWVPVNGTRKTRGSKTQFDSVTDKVS